jgi:type I restriction enzyme S subunit
VSLDQVSIGRLVEDGLANIQTGPFGTQLKAADYVSEGVPVINVRNIGYSNLKADKVEFVTETTAERLNVHVLAGSDIVFSRKGAVDRHLFVTSDQAGWLQGSDCIRLRFSGERVNSRFVSYAFLRASHKAWMLQQCGNKATMASLNQDVICRITVPLPRRDQQDEVVRLLSVYDDLIENNRRRIALLEEAARMLYREWFVRFPGHEHVPLIDGIPEGWERRSLGSILTLKRGYDLPEAQRVPGEVPIISSAGISGFHNQHKALGPGVVTGRYGTLGEVYYIERDYWPLNTALYVVDFQDTHPLMAFHLLKTLLKGYISEKAAVPGVDRNVLHTLQVIWPGPRLRDAFVEAVSDNQSQIRVLGEMSHKLAQARDLLLPRLMSGEIAV